MRDFIRRHQLANPDFLFFAAYSTLLLIATVVVGSHPEILNG